MPTATKSPRAATLRNAAAATPDTELVKALGRLRLSRHGAQLIPIDSATALA